MLVDLEKRLKVMALEPEQISLNGAGWHTKHPPYMATSTFMVFSTHLPTSTGKLTQDLLPVFLVQGLWLGLKGQWMTG